MNPKFGLVGSISFLYYMLFELFSPIIQLIGLVFIGLGFYLELVNVPFMLFFYLWSLFFGAVLSIAAFFTRVYTYRTKLPGLDYIKAVLLCILENFGYRQMIALFSLSGFLSYRKYRRNWDKIQRKRFDNAEGQEEGV